MRKEIAGLYLSWLVLQTAAALALQNKMASKTNTEFQKVYYNHPTRSTYILTSHSQGITLLKMT